MKKKVLFLTTQFNHGGVERSLVEVCKALDENKYDITVFLRNNKTELVPLLPDYVKVIVNQDGHYFRKPKAICYKLLSNVFSLFKNKRKAEKYSNKLSDFIYEEKIKNPHRRYFANKRFDVVVSYTVHLCTEMALLINADKHYVFFHSEEADFHQDITAKTFPQYDKIVAVGPGVEILLRENFPQFNDKIIQLCNYIDAPKIYRLAKEIPQDVESVKAKDVTMLATSARMVTEKGYELAVEAARIIKEQKVDFEWFFLGDGAERPNVESLINKYHLNDRIHLKGFVNNPYPYMSECDIYVHPAYLEAQPLAIMEAIVLGKAIVSTDSLGGKAVLNYGEKGLLVSQNAKAIAEGILTFLKNPQLKESFENRYTREDNMREKKEYAEQWDKLLSE